MSKVPLVGGAYQARSIIANAQRCVNLYPEENQSDAPFPTTHYQTPGLHWVEGDTRNVVNPAAERTKIYWYDPESITIKWAYSDSSDPEGSFAVDGAVIYMAVNNGILYVCGFINSVDGVHVDFFAKYDGVSWTNGGVIANDVTTYIEFNNGNIYLSGAFTEINSIPCSLVAKYDGVSWSQLGDGVSGYAVMAISATDSGIYVGGIIDCPSKVMFLDSGSFVDAAPGASLDGDVYTMQFASDNLLIGGNFSTNNGDPISKCATIFMGTIYDIFAPFTGDHVRTIKYNSTTDAVYICGNFSEILGTACNSAAIMPAYPVIDNLGLLIPSGSNVDFCSVSQDGNAFFYSDA